MLKSSSERTVRKHALYYALHCLNTKPGMPPPRQADVARMIGVDPRRFSEALTEARRLNLLAEAFIRPPSMSDDEWRECHERFHDFDLAERVRRAFVRARFPFPPRDIRVVGAGRTQFGGDARRRVFAVNAAEILMPVLMDTNTTVIAVAWGQMMRDLCRHGVARFCGTGAPRRRAKVWVFGVCGEPFQQSQDVSPSAVATELCRLLNGDTKRVLSLAGVPAVIPGALAQHEIDSIYKMLNHVEAFTTAFGTGGLAEKMTTLISSFGPVDSISSWTGRCRRLTGFARIRTRLAGDLASVPVPATDDPAALAEIQKYSERLPGLAARHVVALAAEGRKNKAYNVVLIGMGRERAKCLWRICELGWASIVIIDRDLALALADR